MNTKLSTARFPIGHYIAAVAAFMMLAMILACGGAGTDSSTPAPTAPESATSGAPEIDIAYSTLRKWSPDNASRGLGLEIVLEQDDVTEQDLIDLIKQLSSGHDPVVIRVFKSRTAYEQEQTNGFGPEYKSDYLLMYVKNGTGSGAYSGFNEIRWMQEVGEFADKYGAKTQL